MNHMILVNKEHIGDSIEIITATTLFIIILTSLLGWLITKEHPVIATASDRYIHEITPGVADIKYVSSFADIFIERLYVWDHRNYTANMQLAAYLASNELSDVIRKTASRKLPIVELLQMSQRIKPIKKVIRKHNHETWEYQVDFIVTIYDRSVPRPGRNMRATLQVSNVIPTSNYPYGCEVVSFVDGAPSDVPELTQMRHDDGFQVLYIAEN